ncbi:MAG: DNA double-strand break repair nuclease NurA [Thermoplasmatota archaeon]
MLLEEHAFGDAPRRLAALLAMDAAAPLRVERLEPRARAAPPRCAAVDGSSGALVEGPGVLAGASRAGYVLLSHARAAERVVGTTRVGLYAAEAELTRARDRAEHDAALAALARLGPGDLLLLDGGLRATHAVLVEAGRARGVDVVAVAKSTSRTLAGDAPAVGAARRAARDAGLAKEAWCAEIPPALPFARDFVARLHPVEGWAFLVAVAAADDSAASARAALGRAAALADHPAYAGYPSPLAMAHNAVLLSDDAQRELARDLREAAIAQGADREAWDLAFTDYHDILELGA